MNLDKTFSQTQFIGLLSRVRNLMFVSDLLYGVSPLMLSHQIQSAVCTQLCCCYNEHSDFVFDHRYCKYWHAAGTWKDAYIRTDRMPGLLSFWDILLSVLEIVFRRDRGVRCVQLQTSLCIQVNSPSAGTGSAWSCRIIEGRGGGKPLLPSNRGSEVIS